MLILSLLKAEAGTVTEAGLLAGWLTGLLAGSPLTGVPAAGRPLMRCLRYRVVIPGNATDS